MSNLTPEEAFQKHKRITGHGILAEPVNLPAGYVCSVCGNMSQCTCALSVKHKLGCRYLRAAILSVDLPCPHGFQACPICDPCTCGAGEKGGIR
jgi:hypothetical protein